VRDVSGRVRHGYAARDGAEGTESADFAPRRPGIAIEGF
jgi:hypothetical protein